MTNTNSTLLKILTVAAESDVFPGTIYVMSEGVFDVLFSKNEDAISVLNTCFGDGRLVTNRKWSDIRITVWFLEGCVITLSGGYVRVSTG